VPIVYQSLTVGPLGTNCYILWDQSTLTAAIIDPGGDAARIRQAVSSNGLKPGGILLTHGHADHCFAAGYIAREYGTEIHMHQADIDQVNQTLATLETIYDVSSFVELSPLKLITDGDVIRLGESSISVIHTPGHSPGGVCFATDAGIFCGDTIFAGSIGRTDFPGGDHDQLINSIKTRLLTLPDTTLLLPGHGPSTTVGRERSSNPFLT
jgi:hydroxyacylglutathione hydrolase